LKFEAKHEPYELPNEKMKQIRKKNKEPKKKSNRQKKKKQNKHFSHVKCGHVCVCGLFEVGLKDSQTAFFDPSVPSRSSSGTFPNKTDLAKRQLDRKIDPKATGSAKGTTTSAYLVTTSPPKKKVHSKSPKAQDPRFFPDVDSV
jgi:hypothetical protein